MADFTMECWGSPPASTPSGEWQQLDAGNDHFCAVTGGGEWGCWGSDSHGQISEAPDDTLFSQISAGRRHTCGVEKDTGELHCWGDDSANQVSDLPTGPFQHVGAGWYQTCGVRESSAVECWGCNGADWGQCDTPL